MSTTPPPLDERDDFSQQPKDILAKRAGYMVTTAGSARLRLANLRCTHFCSHHVAA